mgnify:CR=1 FL=1
MTATWASTKLQQMPLAFQAPERLDFSLFVSGDNATCCQQVQYLAAQDGGQLYLWGASGVGKTHLLQAACQDSAQQQRRPVYLPLRELAGHDPGLLDGLEECDLIVMDDLQLIAADADWEQAVFSLYNRLRDSGKAMLFAADSSPRGLLLQLPDLTSRLGWGEVYHLQPLSDDDKCLALTRRAAARGIDLPMEVANYLLRRTVRNMAGLMDWLDHLDQAQLAAQRRLSIPFVKSLLEDSGLAS